jgi:predicted enzyme related to lactoylglutathione lyase
MGTRTEHAPGTFSWVDLTTSDADGAKAFYGALFGWELEDAGPLTMGKVGGEYVCAIPPSTTMAAPRWNNYVTVASADDAAARATELGGTLVEQPFDVPGAGRLALLQDPWDATLCVWEPRGVIGATRVNEPGCLTWNELHTTDVGGALAFYGGLFGWTSEEAGGGYHVLRNGERSNGGVMEARPGEPPGWLPYFAVESLDRGLAKAGEGGGATLAGPIQMPAGRIAVLRDPQGAMFALWEGQLDD